MGLSDAANKAVRRHYEAFWPDRAQEEFGWALGPIEDRIPGFKVRRVAPVVATDPWIYITIGVAGASGGTGEEFFLLAPSESPRHVETLAMVASFHADPGLGLELGKTVDIGRPWLESALADHLLVSLPYPYGPDLEHCAVPGGGHVRTLWLVPITRAEAALAADSGLEALEQLLEDSGVDVISASRPSLA